MVYTIAEIALNEAEAHMSALAIEHQAPRFKPARQKKAPFDRARMEKALASGPAVAIPAGLSREEKRQFILNSAR